MSLSRTSKWKVMTIQISRELPLFIFQHVDISWASDIHPSQKLWLFKFAASFRVQFQAPNILCAWIRHPSEKLWPFKFLESFRCSFWSMSIYQGPHTYTRVKSYGCLNLPRASVFNFDRLDLLCSWINIQVKYYDHLNYSRAFIAHFLASWYIMGLTHTPESKVIAVWICRELTCSISSVSIYCRTESDIRVKSSNHLNFSRASMVHFRASRNIMSLTHTPESKVMAVSIFWELLSTISRVSIYYEPESDIQVKSYDHSNFSRASIVHFPACRYIMGLTHTPESKVMAVWICRELSFLISSARYIMRLNRRSE